MGPAWAAGGAGGGAVFVESDCANAGAAAVMSATSIAANVERACLMITPGEMKDDAALTARMRNGGRH